MPALQDSSESNAGSKEVWHFRLSNNSTPFFANCQAFNKQILKVVY